MQNREIYITIDKTSTITYAGATQVDIGGVTMNITVASGSIKLEMAATPTAEFNENMDVTFAVSGGSYDANQGESLSVKTTQKAEIGEMRKYAQGEVDLNALEITDGSTITIGSASFTIAVGQDSENKDNADIKLTAYEEGDANLAKYLARELSMKSSTEFIISTPNDDGVIHLTEKGDNVDYDVNDLQGTSAAQDGDWKGLVTFKGGSSGSSTAGGLTLQIGDTSDPYNQLSVSIDDMHVDALNIGDIDITSQTGAQEAVNKIKEAINKVSMTRGTLGATQNRLEHTANNLAVMEENIQDAESTIRDTDIAEEMMSYTKNNILIQSAQAMLAQANMVPQGVLQLLQ